MCPYRPLVPIRQKMVKEDSDDFIETLCGNSETDDVSILVPDSDSSRESDFLKEPPVCKYKCLEQVILCTSVCAVCIVIVLMSLA